MSSRRLSPRARKAVLALHVGASVALIGVTGSVLIVALRAAGADRASEAHALYTSAQMLAFALAIPFSLTSLATGVVLGLGTRWGVAHLPLGGGQARAAACDHPHRCARRQAFGAGADRPDRGRPAAGAMLAGRCPSRVPPTWSSRPSPSAWRCSNRGAACGPGGSPTSLARRRGHRSAQPTYQARRSRWPGSSYRSSCRWTVSSRTRADRRDGIAAAGRSSTSAGPRATSSRSTR